MQLLSDTRTVDTGHFFHTSLAHCLNKRERPLHSKRNSILRDEPNIEVNCPVLLMAKLFFLVWPALLDFEFVLTNNKQHF
jgi:hypothetical protein